MATQCFFTTVRMICDNMLNIATSESSLEGNGIIKIRHTQEFNAQAVKEQLGLAPKMMEDFGIASKEMARRNLKHDEAIQFLVDIVGNPDKDIEEQENARAIKGIYELYDGKGKGSDLITAKGTLWGLVNGVTEYIDHHRGQSADTRVHSAAFGSGSKTKSKAWSHAMEMVA